MTGDPDIAYRCKGCGWWFPTGCATAIVFEGCVHHSSEPPMRMEAAGTAERVQSIALACGTCAECGFYNGNPATAEPYRGPVYCRNCGHVWSHEEPS